MVVNVIYLLYVGFFSFVTLRSLSFIKGIYILLLVSVFMLLDEFRAELLSPKLYPHLQTVYLSNVIHSKQHLFVKQTIITVNLAGPRRCTSNAVCLHFIRHCRVT